MIRRFLQIALAAVSAVVTLTAADRAPFTFPRSTPEAQGVSSAGILRFVEEAESKIDALHSIMIVRHGHVVAEGWWSPYAADEPHVLFSLSKSFTSTAVGLAVAEGKLSVDDLVMGFFPEETPADASANLRAMRVRDLLTMSTGHHDEAIATFPYNSDDSLVKKFLSLPVAHKPGTLFVYNTPASYMLSAIVQKVTGQPIVDYLGPRLFEPLGIRTPTWDASHQGISLGGFGLSVRTEDIARFGQLYLQKGMWQGTQILPTAWVEAATTRQMSNGSSTTSDWEQGYGYQFWRCRHGFYRGDGAFGQFCILMPQYDAVVVITSGTRDMPGVLNLVWDRLVPALQSSALPADSAADGKLRAKLSSLSLPAQTGDAAAPHVAGLAGRRFAFGPNAELLEAVTVDAIDAKGQASFTFRQAGADRHVTVSPGAWTKDVASGAKDVVAATGSWTANDTFTMKMAHYRTPFIDTFRLHFAGDQLILEDEHNVGFTESRTTQLVGRAMAAAAKP